VTKEIHCLSIRQPWAWLIANGHKDIENRDWFTPYRGLVLIHAPRRLDDNFDWSLFTRMNIKAPQAFERGGIVGVAHLTAVLTFSESPWFRGPCGFVLRHAQPLKFIPCSGALGLFKPTAWVEAKVRAALELPAQERRCM